MKNKNLFTNVKDYFFKWEVAKNGERVDTGLIEVELAPGAVKKVKLDYALPSEINSADELVLTVSLHLKESTLWAEKGHEIAFEQFILPVKTMAPVMEKVLLPELNIMIEKERLMVSSCRFKVVFNRKNGNMESYVFEDEVLITASPFPNFWRAMTDNDRGNGLPERSKIWREAGQNRALQFFTFVQSKNCVEVTVHYQLATIPVSFLTLHYSVFRNGEIKIFQQLIPGADLPEIPEIGLLFIMDASFQSLEWYGRGPHESYWDRKQGAKLGLYRGKVEEQYAPYLKPQECGNKTDVRWVKISNDQEIGLSILGVPSFECNALPYLPQELEGMIMDTNSRKAIR